MLDIAAVNAFVVWTKINPGYHVGKRHRRRLFLEELGQTLACTLPVVKPTRTLPTPQLASENKRSRCHLCPRNVDKKVPSKCSKCQKFTCLGHSVCYECGNQ